MKNAGELQCSELCSTNSFSLFSFALERLISHLNAGLALLKLQFLFFEEFGFIIYGLEAIWIAKSTFTFWRSS